MVTMRRCAAPGETSPSATMQSSASFGRSAAKGVSKRLWKKLASSQPGLFLTEPRFRPPCMTTPGLGEMSAGGPRTSGSRGDLKVGGGRGEALDLAFSSGMQQAQQAHMAASVDKPLTAIKTYESDKESYKDTGQKCRDAGFTFTPLVFELHGGGFSLAARALLTKVAQFHEVLRRLCPAGSQPQDRRARLVCPPPGRSAGDPEACLGGSFHRVCPSSGAGGSLGR